MGRGAEEARRVVEKWKKKQIEVLEDIFYRPSHVPRSLHPASHKPTYSVKQLLESGYPRLGSAASVRADMSRISQPQPSRKRTSSIDSNTDERRLSVKKAKTGKDSASSQRKGSQSNVQLATLIPVDRQWKDAPSPIPPPTMKNVFASLIILTLDSFLTQLRLSEQLHTHRSR